MNGDAWILATYTHLSFLADLLSRNDGVSVVAEAVDSKLTLGEFYKVPLLMVLESPQVS